MKTALQHAIEEIKAKPQIVKAEALAILYALLPTIQEQIEEAYEVGYNNAILECGTPKSTTASEYYTETFKTDK